MSSNIKYAPLSRYESGLDFTSQFTFSGDKKARSGKDAYINLTNDGSPVATKQTFFDCICTSIAIMFSFILFLLTFPISGYFSLKLAHQYERIIVYRLGRLCPVKGPGLVLVLPCVDRWHVVDLRTKAFNVPPSKLCTTDGCIISIGAMIQFRITNPLLMSLSVQDVNHAMRDSSMADMTNLLSKKSYHDIKSKRQRLGYDLQADINESCKEWGAEVSRVELSDITLLVAPQNQNQSSFMPMFGAAPPPSQGQTPFGGNALGGLAQFAQQFLAQTASANNEPKPISDSSLVSSTGSVVEDMIMKVEAIMGPRLVEDVGVTFEFDITDLGRYHLDLKNIPGTVGRGSLPNNKPDVVLSLSQATLQDLLSGSITSTSAYTMNKLRVEGSTADAMKLDKVFKSIQ